MNECLTQQSKDIIQKQLDQLQKCNKDKFKAQKEMLNNPIMDLGTHDKETILSIISQNEDKTYLEYTDLMDLITNMKTCDIKVI